MKPTENKQAVIDLLRTVLPDGLYQVVSDSDPLQGIRIVPVDPSNPPARLIITPEKQRRFIPPAPWQRELSPVNLNGVLGHQPCTDGRHADAEPLT
ncbi:MAG TPA: hypothetical protein VK689_21895 [Armatimonadota bacterium]|nr:hypothetical protein [Armatimonadota bacterium]